MLIAVWLIALVVLGLWTLGAWGLHTLLVALPNDWSGLAVWVEKLPANPWLENFFPGWQSMLTWVLKLAESALSWAGGAADVMGWAVWLIWGVGALFVLGCAVVGSLIVALVRKSMHKVPAAVGS
jgi:hypothetical protein